MAAQTTILTTTTGKSSGTRIFVEPGSKSQHDFRVRYREPGARDRTPKHIHVIIDLYLKAVGNPTLTAALVDHLIDGVFHKVRPATSYPPSLQVHTPGVLSTMVTKFDALDAFGEYGVEFLLVTVELIMIQERTNYAAGTMTLELFKTFRQSKELGGNEGIFRVVSTATFNGPG